MNKFYGGWSPMGQAFKSMQNQRGFAYRKLDAIKFQNLLLNHIQKNRSKYFDQAYGSLAMNQKLWTIFYEISVL